MNLQNPPDTVGFLESPDEYERPMCPIDGCHFIVEPETRGQGELDDHEWWCPQHGSLVLDASTVQERCPHCGELSDPLPEEYYGTYESPDGESYEANCRTYMHPECADEVIAAIENGHEPVQLDDFA